MSMASERAESGPIRRVLGTLAVSAALAAATVGWSPALAEEPDPGEPAPDGAEGEPIEIEASTLYVSRMSDAIPPTLRTQVPPAAVCVVQPELCPESTEPVRNGLVEALAAANENEPISPVQPIPSDTAAVSFLGGQTRYQTAIKFPLAAVPDGHEVVQFTLTIPQAQPSYELGSPAFRRAVLAAFEAIGPQDPAILADGLAAALEEDPVEIDPELIGIEVCPLLSAFEPGGAPQASPDDAIPHREEGDETVVDVDCIFGSNGMRGDGDVWTFDLTFAADAWAQGELTNHGVLLRPIGAPNLAFGDPDTSTSAQVALDLTEVTVAMATAEPAPPLEDFPGMDGGFEDAVVADAGGFDDGAFDDAGGFDDGGFDDGGLADGGEFDEATLDEGDGVPGADVAGPGGDDPSAAATTAADSGPGQPWWMWLLVPVFVGGAYLTSQALMTGAGAGAMTGGGALSRLMARRDATTV